MPQVTELRGESEFWARLKPLTESADAEWIHIAQDLDTWPGAREAAHRHAQRGGASRARKLYSPAVLADQQDRETLRTMAAHGFQVRVATTPLPQGTVIIDRRTMILTDPPTGHPATHTPHTYTMSASPALIRGTYALFEAAWDNATDVNTILGTQRPSINGRTSEVLRSLASGATDEAAAKELGMSLRTYRRRVAELLVTLGAGSRFQAGVRAAEWGLTRS
ncbi:DNA-binding response regulator [Streptomyces sp. TRM75563]|uniref:DNA-binding response regulator n=1 Tax=Streptomyces sp. TRM75563 TaxID=2817418 RepID=UPI001F5FFD63|nr:DNA-binding response regulator [Streptomyces sp. TRM75563]MCI4039976.1 DNA-binding response regulator [Streptomyces sp. TRM75563]